MESVPFAKSRYTLRWSLTITCRRNCFYCSSWVCNRLYSSIKATPRSAVSFMQLMDLMLFSVAMQFPSEVPTNCILKNQLRKINEIIPMFQMWIITQQKECSCKWTYARFMRGTSERLYLLQYCVTLTNGCCITIFNTKYLQFTIQFR